MLLCVFLSKTLYPLHSTGLTQEMSWQTWNNVEGDNTNKTPLKKLKARIKKNVHFSLGQKENNFTHRFLILLKLLKMIPFLLNQIHTGQCKRTGGCYNELVVAFLHTGDGLKGKKIYTCWLYDLFISLHLFHLWWHLAHRPTVTLQFMALSSDCWFNSWFGLQIQHSSGVLPWQVLFLV